MDLGFDHFYTDHMEMSPQYMAETIEFFASKGFEISQETRTYGEGETASEAFAYRVRCSETVDLELEVVTRANLEPRYFLAIHNYFGLTSFSFQLDSWKFSGERIECKYYAIPETGLGLSIALDLSQAHSLST